METVTFNDVMDGFAHLIYLAQHNIVATVSDVQKVKETFIRLEEINLEDITE